MKKYIVIIGILLFLSSCFYNQNDKKYLLTERGVHFNKGICSIEFSKIKNLVEKKDRLHFVYEGGCKKNFKDIVYNFGEKIWKIDTNITNLDEILSIIGEYDGLYEGGKNLAMELWSNNQYILNSQTIEEIVIQNIEPYFLRNIYVVSQEDKDILCNISGIGCENLIIIKE